MSQGKPPADSSWLGRRLEGRYDVERVLGSGGMATVYLARDSKLGRAVVVKVPHAEFFRIEGFRERFQLEVKSLIRLEHPRVLRILDAGEEGGVPFAVMQYLEGGSLNDVLLRRGRLEALEVLAWLGPVAEALDFIHGAGYVHRDVKPGNILFDAMGNAHVSDFGIAKALGQGEADETLTRTGVTPGSALFIAPEGVEGRYGPAYDQYALAVVVYQALAGRPPHQGASPMAIVVQKTITPPPALSQFAPGLAPAAEAAALRALEIRPEERFESCRAFAAAFAQGIENRSAALAPTAPAIGPLPAGRRTPRHRPLARGIVVAGLSVAFAVALVLALGPWSRPDEEAAVEGTSAHREAARVPSEEEALHAAGEAIDRALGCWYRADATFAELEGHAGEALRITEGLPASAASARLGGDALELLGRPREAEASWRKALERDPGLGSVRFRLGRLLYRRSALHYLSWADLWKAKTRREVAWETAGVAELRQALDPPGGLTDVEEAIARAILYIHAGEGDGEAAKGHMVDSARRLQGRRGIHELIMWGDLGISPGRLEEAVEICPNDPTCRSFLAAVRMGQERYDEAIEESTRALAWNPGLSGARLTGAAARLKRGELYQSLSECDRILDVDADDAKAIFLRAIVLHRLLRPADSAEDMERAVRVDLEDPFLLVFRGELKALLGDEEGRLADLDRAIELWPQNPTLRSARAAARGKAGDEAGALADLDEAVRLDPDSAQALYERANHHSQASRADAALEDLDRALERDADHSHALTLRGAIYHQRSEFERAIQDFEAVTRIEPDNWIAWWNHAGVLDEAGRRQEALSSFRQAERLAPAEYLPTIQQRIRG